MIERGLVIVEGEHVWWKCPCGRVLAELVDDQVIIKAGQRWIVLMRTSDQIQRCPNPRCGTWSVLPAPPQRVA